MPDRDRVIVSNTTPIIALALIKNLDLLQRLYGEVVIPPAVQNEISVGGEGRVGVVELKGATYIKTISLGDPDRAALIADLDRGEAEVIALAQELDANLVIIDERLARWHARRLGIPYTSLAIRLDHVAGKSPRQAARRKTDTNRIKFFFMESPLLRPLRAVQSQRCGIPKILSLEVVNNPGLFLLETPSCNAHRPHPPYI